MSSECSSSAPSCLASRNKNARIIGIEVNLDMPSSGFTPAAASAAICDSAKAKSAADRDMVDHLLAGQLWTMPRLLLGTEHLQRGLKTLRKAGGIEANAEADVFRYQAGDDLQQRSR